MKIADGVIWKQVGDELVLLDYERGIYFGLDAVGARIWQLIDEQQTEATIVDQLLDEFDVTREVVAGDVDRLVAELAERGLITR